MNDVINRIDRIFQDKKGYETVKQCRCILLSSVCDPVYSAVPLRAFAPLRAVMLCGLLLPVLSITASAQKSASPTYQSLLPILKSRCIVCHNQAALDNKTLSGGLALDTFALLKRGVVLAKGNRAIYTSGNIKASELIQRLKTTSPTKLMPRGGPPLPPEQIALFEKWVASGAPEGNPSAEPKTATVPKTAPLPANPGLSDVRLSTLMKPSASLLKETNMKEGTLEFALKVGPLTPVTALAWGAGSQFLAVGGFRSVMIWTDGGLADTLTGFSGQVYSVAFSPDGHSLAVGSGAPGESGEVRVIDLPSPSPSLNRSQALREGGEFKAEPPPSQRGTSDSGKGVGGLGRLLSGHTDIVYSVAWSPDGKMLASASQDKTVRLWEWPSGKEVRVLKDNTEAVTRVAFAPDGKSLYTASQDRNLRRFNMADGTVMHTYQGHEQGVTALAITPGNQILSSGTENRIRWWTPEDGNIFRNTDGHGDVINEIVISKDGKRIASASGDHTIRIWDENGGHQRTLEGAKDWLYCVAITPDAKLVAAAGADGLVHLWETATGRLRLTLFGWPGANGGFAAFTPEGYASLTGDWPKKLRLELAGKPVSMKGLPAVSAGPSQIPSLQKAWKGEPLEPIKLP